MLSARAIVPCAALALFGCHNDEGPGFEIVRVPLSAYASPDGGARSDGAVAQTADAGAGPIVLCVAPKQSSDSDDDESSSDDCADHYEGRRYDEKATTRHRNKGEEGVCCYRRGRFPYRVEDSDRE